MATINSTCGQSAAADSASPQESTADSIATATARLQLTAIVAARHLSEFAIAYRELRKAEREAHGSPQTTLDLHELLSRRDWLLKYAEGLQVPPDHDGDSTEGFDFPAP